MRAIGSRIMYTNYLYRVPSGKEKLDTCARLEASFRSDFCVNVRVIIVSLSRAPPAELVHRPGTRWIARWGSVGRCYRRYYKEEKKRD
jgi:hypothetical protein